MTKNIVVPLTGQLRYQEFAPLQKSRSSRKKCSVDKQYSISLTCALATFEQKLVLCKLLLLHPWFSTKKYIFVSSASPSLSLLPDVELLVIVVGVFVSAVDPLQPMNGDVIEFLESSGAA